jgi:hypothetical protein
VHVPFSSDAQYLQEGWVREAVPGDWGVIPSHGAPGCEFLEAVRAMEVTVADPTDAQEWADALRRCHREAPALAAAAELEAARRRCECECKAWGQEQQQSGSPSCELPLAGAGVIRELEVAAPAAPWAALHRAR